MKTSTMNRETTDIPIFKVTEYVQYFCILKYVYKLFLLKYKPI